MTRLTSSATGFSLIELLIVIAILAILVSIVAVNVTTASGTAAETTLLTETRLVQLAIDQYNKWDVTVSGNPAIPAQLSAIQVSHAVGTFGKYLDTPTHYTYTWSEDGAGLAARQ